MVSALKQSYNAQTNRQMQLKFYQHPKNHKQQQKKEQDDMYKQA